VDRAGEQPSDDRGVNMGFWAAKKIQTTNGRLDVGVCGEQKYEGGTEFEKMSAPFAQTTGAPSIL